MPACTPVCTVDAVGLLCPVPIYKTAKAIKDLAVGEVIELLVDDEQILEDLPAWCASVGHTLLTLEEVVGAPGEYRGLIRKEAARR